VSNRNDCQTQEWYENELEAKDKRIAELEQECEVLLERLDAEYLAEAELQEDDK
jgi:hypothetical protein